MHERSPITIRPESKENDTSELAGRPVIVGEVLFDVMPDGTQVLGGAPFNVAWHLEAFGLDPLMITRVGADQTGDQVLAAMEGWGLDTSGVQRAADRPTGRVQVDLEDGQPTFHILADQAYDHLDGDRAKSPLVGETLCLLYHGSLILRGEISRSALTSLKDESGLPVFMDVNLRAPWWNRQDVAASVRDARWVKINEDELAELAGASTSAAAESFLIDHELEAVIVTMGSRGAFIADGDGTSKSVLPPKVSLADTVGSGDAFSAVVILGLINGWPIGQTLERAVAFAAAICTVPGATTTDRRLYSKFRSQGWW